MDEVGGARDRDRARAVGGVRADRLHPRHHRPVLPAVRADDRGLDDHLGVQLADACRRRSARCCFKPHDAGARAPRFFLARSASGFATGFNRGFDTTVARLSRAVHASRGAEAACSWHARRLCRPRSALTVHGVARVPTGFIPAQDQGYLITVIQLPPTAPRSTRTDAVVRRATEIMLDDARRRRTPSPSPASTARPSPTRRTPARSSSRSKPFEERAKHGPARPTRSSADLSGASAGDPGGLRHRHAAAAGARHRHRRRLQDAGRRTAAARTAPARARAARRSSARPTRLRASPACSPPSTPARRRSTLDIDRDQGGACSACRSTDVFETLQVYLGSAYVNDFNFLGRTYQVTAQADSDVPHDRERHRCSSRRATPRGDDGAARLGRRRSATSPARTACRATTCIPRPRCTATRAPGVSLRPGARRRWSSSRAERCRRASASSGPSSPSRSSSPATRRSTSSRLRCCSSSCVLAAQYESWALPLAVILIVPMCLLAALIGVLLRGHGQQHPRPRSASSCWSAWRPRTRS